MAQFALQTATDIEKIRQSEHFLLVKEATAEYTVHQQGLRKGERSDCMFAYWKEFWRANET